MTLAEWLAEVSDDTVSNIKSVGNVDGIPNVATVNARLRRPVAGGTMNSWTWMIPLLPGTEVLFGEDNPYAFVWGPDWFEFADEHRAE